MSSTILYKAYPPVRQANLQKLLFTGKGQLNNALLISTTIMHFTKIRCDNKIRSIVDGVNVFSKNNREIS